MRVGWRLLVLDLAVCFSCQGEMAKDTARFAEHLGRFRQYKVYELPAAEYKTIQNEYLSWVDSRWKAGKSVAEMNQELAAANLLSKGPETMDDRFDRTYAGFLGGVGDLKLSGADDLRAVKIGIYTGGYCNFDETVIFYDGKTLRRVTQINAERVYSHGYILRAIAAGIDPSSRGKIIGSEWVASNCTSNWNGNILRIDLSRGEALDNVLNRSMEVFGGGEVNLEVKDGVVICEYTSGFSDLEVLIRGGVARYRVQDGRAIRVAPIAKSFGGFIDEWLKMDDTEAARWAPPQASARHRGLVTEGRTLEWTKAADCPGSPRSRAIAIQSDQVTRQTVFVVSGQIAEEMRMLSILDEIPAGCKAIPSDAGRFSSIRAEPTEH